jgi:hypothetical protein
MGNSNESEIKNLQSSLKAAKNATSADLQRSVIKKCVPPKCIYFPLTLKCSYAEFFTLAKELTTLENDLLELKASLAEWKSMPSLLNIDEYASTGSYLCHNSPVGLI